MFVCLFYSAWDAGWETRFRSLYFKSGWRFLNSNLFLEEGQAHLANEDIAQDWVPWAPFLNSLSKLKSINVPSWPSVSLSVQRAQWHSMAHWTVCGSAVQVPARVGTCPWAAGPGQPCRCTLMMLLASSPLAIFSPSVHIWIWKTVLLKLGLVFLAPGDNLCNYPEGMHRAQDGFQSLCPVFCQETFWQACLLQHLY